MQFTILQVGKVTYFHAKCIAVFVTVASWKSDVMYTMFTNKIRKHTLLPVLCAYTNSLTHALQATPIAAGLRRTIVQSL